LFQHFSVISRESSTYDDSDRESTSSQLQCTWDRVGDHLNQLPPLPPINDSNVTRKLSSTDRTSQEQALNRRKSSTLLGNRFSENTDYIDNDDGDDIKLQKETNNRPLSAPSPVAMNLLCKVKGSSLKLNEGEKPIDFLRSSCLPVLPPLPVVKDHKDSLVESRGFKPLAKKTNKMVSSRDTSPEVWPRIHIPTPPPPSNEAKASGKIPALISKPLKTPAKIPAKTPLSDKAPVKAKSSVPVHTPKKAAKPTKTPVPTPNSSKAPKVDKATSPKVAKALVPAKESALVPVSAEKLAAPCTVSPKTRTPETSTPVSLPAKAPVPGLALKTSVPAKTPVKLPELAPVLAKPPTSIKTALPTPASVLIPAKASEPAPVQAEPPTSIKTALSTPALTKSSVLVPAKASTPAKIPIVEAPKTPNISGEVGEDSMMSMANVKDVLTTTRVSPALSVNLQDNKTRKTENLLPPLSSEVRRTFQISTEQRTEAAGATAKTKTAIYSEEVSNNDCFSTVDVPSTFREQDNEAKADKTPVSKISSNASQLELKTSDNKMTKKKKLPYSYPPVNADDNTPVPKISSNTLPKISTSNNKNNKKKELSSRKPNKGTSKTNTKERAHRMIALPDIKSPTRSKSRKGSITPNPTKQPKESRSSPWRRNMSARPRLTSYTPRRLQPPPSVTKRDGRWLIENTTKTWKELILPHISVGEQDIVNAELPKMFHNNATDTGNDCGRSKTTKRDSFPPILTDRSTTAVMSSRRHSTSLNLIKSEPVLQKSGRQRRDSGCVVGSNNTFNESKDLEIKNQTSSGDLGHILTLSITGRTVLKRR